MRRNSRKPQRAATAPGQAAAPARRRKFEIVDPRRSVGGRLAKALGVLGVAAAAAQNALASVYASLAGGVLTGAEAVEDRLAERSLNRRRAAAKRAKRPAGGRALQKTR